MREMECTFNNDNLKYTGLCACNARSIKYLLSTLPKSPYTGKAAILIVSGALKAMESLPDAYHIIIKRRKGFVKFAQEHG